MPQDSRHPDYSRRLGQWTKCRDSVEGEDSIKGRRTKYLPAPSGMPDGGGGTRQYSDGNPGFSSYGGDYERYIQLADWFGAAERTVEGFLGLIFRRPVTIRMPEAWEATILPHLENITRTGVPIDAFCSLLMKELLTTSRVGVLVDQPGKNTPIPLRRPHWRAFKAEDIINWDRIDIQGVPTLARVILEGSILRSKISDPYEKEEVNIWHELVLAEIPVVEVQGSVLTALRYNKRTWQRGTGNRHSEFVELDPIIPTRFDSPLPFLPFTFINSNDLDVSPPKPDLLALADKCLSYYQTSADYKWGLHWTMLKTLFILGPDLGKTPVRLGGTSAINIASKDPVTVQLVEPDGATSDVLRQQLEAVKSEMAILGSRLLSGQTSSGVEAAETVAWRHMGEQSVLQSRVNMCSMGIEKVLRQHCYWVGLTNDIDDDRVSVSINTDFLPVGLTAPMLTALTASLQNGIMTAEDIHYLLAQGESLAPEHIANFELWQSRRENEMIDTLTSGFELNGRVSQRNDLERSSETTN